MNSIKTISTFVLLVIAFNTFSQNRNYKTETAKDGKTTVKYETVKEDEGRHFYYIVEHNAKASVDELDAYLSNSSNHKNFLESTPNSEEVKRISIAYYIPGGSVPEFLVNTWFPQGPANIASNLGSRN